MWEYLKLPRLERDIDRPSTHGPVQRRTGSSNRGRAHAWLILFLSDLVGLGLGFSRALKRHLEDLIAEIGCISVID